MSLLEVDELVKHFPATKRADRQAPKERGLFVRAVDGISFRIEQGETLGLVGESGCGKSTTGRCILRLIEPTAGDVRFQGRSVPRLTRTELKKLRPEMQIVFQDPDATLNPRMTVKSILAEPLWLHGIARRREAKELVGALLERVGLMRAHGERYPNELSGGQQQRVAIARALATNPKFVVLDEPTSALDVSVKVTIVDLLDRLKAETGIAFLLISHDLGVVRYLADRVAVMYVGKLVETGETRDIFENPTHPYTRALLSAIAVPDPAIRTVPQILPGEVPSSIDLPPGCRFYDRCPLRVEHCRENEPPLFPITDRHEAACFVTAAPAAGEPDAIAPCEQQAGTR